MFKLLFDFFQNLLLFTSCYTFNVEKQSQHKDMNDKQKLATHLGEKETVSFIG